jgi:hypothetical protein
MDKHIFNKETDVLGYQRDKIKSLDNRVLQTKNDIDKFENKVQEFISLNNIGTRINTEYIEINYEGIDEVIQTEKKSEKNFNDLLGQAHKNGYLDTELYEIASDKEIKEANYLLKSYYKDFTEQYSLDKYDYAISGIIGTMAALMDYYLVTKVDGKKVVPGKLNSGVEDLWNKLLSNEKIRKLEEKYKVPYDISQSTSKISQEVLGLCPLYHRFISLGHDPILGFIFGVRDLMKGQLTAIDGYGRWIVQTVDGAEGKSFIESIVNVFGHFLSDVSTKSKTGMILSVPAPLTPLLQMVQEGCVEYKGKKYTVADLSKKMYYDGYNFNHFIGMSMPVIMIEILTRLAFVVKEMFFLKKDVIVKGNPKLTVMITIANGMLFAENVGKISITKNPFSINYVSWIATAKYGFKTLKWLAYDQELGKIEYAQEYLDTTWKYLKASADQISSNLPVHLIN